MGEIRTARRPFSWSSIAAFVVEAVAACAFVIAVYEVVVAGGLALLPKPGGKWILVLLVTATAIAGAGMTPVRTRAGALARKMLPAADPTHALRSAVSGAVAAGPADDALPRLAELLAERAGARSATVWQAGPSGRLRCTVSWPEGSWADGSRADGSRADGSRADGSRADGFRPDGVGPGTVGDEAELRELADYVAPVRDGGKVIGWLALRAREGGFLVLPDVRLAEDVANVAGLLLRNAELTSRLREQVRVKTAQAGELAASRRRLVVAGDAARERLSAEIQARVCEPLERCAEQVERVLRDLDGPAGPGTDDAQAEPGPDDAQAGPDLDRIATGPALVAELAGISAEINAAIADFRRIVHGVYPPVLTDHGLRAAMETLLAELEPGASLMPPKVARLAPRVEEASYFCAAALLREWQAAGAQRPMRVLVGVSSSRIEMTFVDGVTRTPERPASPVSPLVLEEVQDRVAALGGDLQIEGDDSGRLLVIAVPLVTADLAAWADGGDR